MRQAGLALVLLLAPLLLYLPNATAYFLGPGGWGRIGVFGVWRSPSSKKPMGGPKGGMSTNSNNKGLSRVGVAHTSVAMKSVSTLPKDVGEDMSYRVELEGLERQVKTKIDEAVKVCHEMRYTVGCMTGKIFHPICLFHGDTCDVLTGGAG